MQHGGTLGSNPQKQLNDAEVLRVLEVWKEALKMQQHFNGISMQIRNFALTLLVAVLGVAAVALREGGRVALFLTDGSLASVILIAGMVGWLGFYLMDRHWYHRFLKATVQHAEKVEATLAPYVSEVGLTTEISRQSPWSAGHGKIRSGARVDGFYGLMGLVLLILAIANWDSGSNKPTEPAPLAVRVLEWPQSLGVRVDSSGLTLDGP